MGIYKSKLKEHYGYIFEDALLEKICNVSKYKKVSSDEAYLNIGETIQFMPLLIKGAIKVSRVDAIGNQVFL